MISINGELQNISQLKVAENRGFLYGDALFDTLIYKNEKFIFLEAHYFRMLASMRQLRMEIPVFFTQEYWEEQMLKTMQANSLNEARVRTSIFRNSGGLYRPVSNKTSFLIQATPLQSHSKTRYRLGLYKENFVSSSPISSLKTTNRLINILASIFAKENEFDNCIILNHKKQIAEVNNANIFLVFQNTIATPPLSEGCINGIIRLKLIELLKNNPNYEIVEKIINPFDLQKADEVFITNSVIGIQAITHFKKKTYASLISDELRAMLEDI